MIFLNVLVNKRDLSGIESIDNLTKMTTTIYKCCYLQHFCDKIPTFYTVKTLSSTIKTHKSSNFF